MSVRKKQRDVKFIIYQSLYILIIALLGVNEVTIMNIPKPITAGEIKVRETEYDSLKLRPELKNGEAIIDTVSKAILDKSDTESMVSIDKNNQMVINKSEYERLKNNQKTGRENVTIRINEPVTDPVVTPNIKGGQKK